MAQQLNLPGMGTLNVHVLDQVVRHRWRDGTGFMRPLEELDTSHLANIPPFLLRKGEPLRGAWVMAQGISYLTGPFSDHGGNMDAAWEEWLQFEETRPLEEWLEDRPMIQRIRRILRVREIKRAIREDDLRERYYPT